MYYNIISLRWLGSSRGHYPSHRGSVPLSTVHLLSAPHTLQELVTESGDILVLVLVVSMLWVTMLLV